MPLSLREKAKDGPRHRPAERGMQAYGPAPLAVFASGLRAAEPSLHPLELFVIAVHCVPWSPSAMIRIWVPDHPSGHAQLPERGIHLLGLLDRDARVRFTVDKQCRRLHT